MKNVVWSILVLVLHHLIFLEEIVKALTFLQIV